MKECKSKIETFNNASYLILVVPLLFETATYLRLINESLLIDCSEKTQLERVTNRDGSNPKLIKLIIKSQADRNLRIKKADKIILNEGSMEDLSNNIQLIHKDIITKIDNLL